MGSGRCGFTFNKLWALIASPTFLFFELVHCNEIVGLVAQCARPTPKIACQRGKLEKKPYLNLRFQTAHTRDSNPQLFSWSSYLSARTPSQFNHWTGGYAMRLPRCEKAMDPRACFLPHGLLLRYGFKNLLGSSSSVTQDLWYCASGGRCAQTHVHEEADTPYRCTHGRLINPVIR